MNHPQRDPRRFKLMSLLAGGAILIAWALLDWPSGKSDLRAFDPAQVSRLETSMWRAYYEERPVSLFFDLAHLMRTQYHFSYLRSYLEAGRATKAAFVFKRGHGRPQYEQALPALVSYYQAISAKSTQPFDAARAARLELEWWIVHREVTRKTPQPLYRALSELQACIYRAWPEVFEEHARARGEAMLLRDEWALPGGLSDERWREIETLLKTSWMSLHRSLQALPASGGAARWCVPAQ